MRSGKSEKSVYSDEFIAPRIGCGKPDHTPNDELLQYKKILSRPTNMHKVLSGGGFPALVVISLTFTSSAVILRPFCLEAMSSLIPKKSK